METTAAIANMVEFLREELGAAARPAKAVQMQAYLKSSQPMLGVMKPARAKIFRQFCAIYPLENFQQYQALIRELWAGNYREELHMALDVALHFREFRSDVAMPLYEELLRSASNWDLVDVIAVHLVGRLVRDNRSHEALLLSWRDDPNFWLRRASLLAHLKHKEQTNLPLLAATIECLMHEKEFFIRKAIGWVLREYGRIDREWVWNFVAQRREALSGLSRREALKHIGEPPEHNF